ncbi:HK97-gp10 family putative phage morphogenesis protein [Tautonia plasticadhaerens]|uniref:Phage protein, HK97 gp10 family n=1 Tax=Tautonia plasticadhaerens TaxID=2527974 RepID=A0A518H240_9BACT|nr:HK97-gp10 family putative phage morphogenesis protein [Tautonia plasticadhaerens]QDV34906.1 hypothetical protein ElP_28030 [Tautonia plasticadhaerens]
MATEGGTFSGTDRSSLGFKVEIDGLDNLRKATELVQKAVDKQVKKALYVAAQRVATEAKKSIQQGGKSGKTYDMRPAVDGEEPTAWFTINGRSVGFVKRSKAHTASAPGEAPASDTGNLTNSIQVDSSVKKENNELIATVSASAKYAKMLEFGTHKIAPRPFMFTALEKSKPFILERIAKAVNDGIGQGSQNTDGAGI